MMDPCSKPYFFSHVNQEEVENAKNLMTYFQLIANRGLKEEHSLLVKVLGEAVINEKARVVSVLTNQNGFFLKRGDKKFATVNNMFLCAFKVEHLEFLKNLNEESFYVYVLNSKKFEYINTSEQRLGCLIQIQVISEIITNLEFALNEDRKEMYRTMIKTLTEQKMELIDQEGNTSLHRAVLDGNIDEIRKLLDLGTDLNSQNYDEFTAIDYLFDEFLNYKNTPKFEEILELFLANSEARELINEKICGTALKNAFKNGNVVCARAILNHIPINKSDIQVEDDKGHLTSYPWYAHYVNDAFNSSETKKLLDLLIEHGADLNKLIVDYPENGPIKFAFRDLFFNLNHHLSIYAKFREQIIKGPLTYFLEKGVNPNFKDSEGNTPLMRCLNDRKNFGEDVLIEIIKTFIHYGADVNIANKDGTTPLHSAVNKRSLALVEFLIDNNANVNQKDAIGNPPLFYTSDIEMVEFLMSRDADINITNGLGNSFLHSCALDDWNSAIVSYLLDNKDRLKINIDLQNIRGMTPLHCAACGRPEITKILIEHKADKTIKDSDGKNPYEFSQFVADDMKQVISSYRKDKFNEAQSYLN